MNDYLVFTRLLLQRSGTYDSSCSTPPICVAVPLPVAVRLFHVHHGPAPVYTTSLTNHPALRPHTTARFNHTAGEGSPSDTKVTPNNPLLTLRHLSTLMQHTLVAMSMQQQHTRLKLDDHLLEWVLALLESEIIRVGVEDCLAAFAARGG